METIKDRELKPQYDKAKSFYNKAVVLSDNQTADKSLISYNTKVADIINSVASVYAIYSNTTLRHIKEFLKQHGFKAESKQQILKDYKEE